MDSTNGPCSFAVALAALREVYAAAQASGRRNMNAMALATVSASGRPGLRHVLMKGLDDQGLVFYTDARSNKAAELAANPRAACCFYWEPIEVQARVDGGVERLADAAIAADFQSRPRAAQTLLWASAQSQPIGSLAELKQAAAEVATRLPDPAPVPDTWTGYRLVPDQIEIWRGARDRVHVRTLFSEREGRWHRQLLAP